MALNSFTPTGVVLVVRGLSKFQSDLKSANRAVSGVGKGFSSSPITAGFAAIGVAAGAAVVAVGGLGVQAIRTAIDFETAFAGVEKTLDGLEEKVGNITFGEKLKEDLVDLSTEIPVTFEKIAKGAELAGQFGIPKEEVAEFSRILNELEVATGKSIEQFGPQLAGIQKIFSATGGATLSTRELGDAITGLGNSTATTEDKLAAYTLRTGGAAVASSIGVKGTLALSAAFLELQVPVERGATGVQKALLKINGAVASSRGEVADYSEEISKNVSKLTSLNGRLVTLEAQTGITGQSLLDQRDAFVASGGAVEEFGRQLGDTKRRQLFEVTQSIQDLTEETDLLREATGQPVSPKELQQFAKVAGLSAEEFATAWETDALGAFNLFIQGLGKAGPQASAILDELQLGDQRLKSAFLPLAANADLLSQKIQEVDESIEEGALGVEFEKRARTTAAQLQLLNNNFRALGNEVGSAFLPTVNKLTKAGIALVKDFIKPAGKFTRDILVPAMENAASKIGELFDAIQSGDFGKAFNMGGLGIAGLFSGISFTDILSGFDTVIANLPTILSQLLDTITTFVTSALPKIQTQLLAWSEAFTSWISNTLVPELGTRLALVLDAIRSFATSGETQAKLLSIGESIGGLIVTGLINIADDQAKLVEVITKIGAGIIAAVGVVSGVLIAVGGQIVAGIIAGILEKIGIDLEPALLTELPGVFFGIAENVKIIAAVIGQAIVDGITTFLAVSSAFFVSAFNTIITTVSDAFVQVKDAIIFNIFAAFVKVSSILNNLAEAFGITDEIRERWSAIFTDMQLVAATIWNLIGTTIATALTTIRSEVATRIEEVRSNFETVLTTFLAPTLATFTAIFTIISNKWTEISTSTSTALTTLGETISTAWTSISETISTAWDSIISAVTLKLAELGLLFIGWLEQTKTDLGNAVEAFINLGGLLVQGLIDGVKAKSAEFVESVTSTVEEGLTSVKEALGIESPSTLFFDIGANIVQGMIDGILSLGGSLLETLGGLFGGLGGMGGGEGEEDATGLGAMLPTIATLQEALVPLQEAFANLFLNISTNMIIILEEGVRYNELLTLIGGTTLPIVTAAITTLSTTTQKAISDMITGFKNVDKTIAKLRDTLEEVAEAIVEAKNKTDEWIKSLERAAGLRERLKKTDSTDAQRGLGFQQGTGRLGFLVPPGFPNDSFPINVTSGERVVVSPPGRSIESVTGMSAGVGGGVTLSIGPVTITDRLEGEMFESRVERVVSNALSPS